MSLAVGARIGAFEILSRLGAGGMGEVYRARDTRLDRIVAIKILPEHLAQHPDLRQRFEREARAVSSLNHSHICALYDIGHQDGTDYLVLEYIEGESLHERLEEGPLPFEQALRYGSEIADALGGAHRSGIIHRDLKPGNVMLTKAGAKLLDFGLARVARPIVSGNGDLSDAATPSEPLTGAGTLLGTIPYMAPEQIEGGEADPRTDIWALGCLLYEMVTGKRAFMATSPASVIGAILRDEPRPMRELVPLTPPSLERLVEKCLDKDPEERWQNAHDVAAELRWIGERRDEPVRTVGRGSRALSLVLAGSVGALLTAGLVWLILGRGSGGRVEGLHVAEAVRFTHEIGLFESPTWSPDGKLVAFASNRSGKHEGAHPLEAARLPEATETEIKIRLEDPAAVRATLVRLGARRERERHLEDDLLFDDAGGVLRTEDATVRLRRTPGLASLTYKGPRRVEQGVRSRLEIETTVGDPDAMQALLEPLGLRPTFHYQKYRESWRWEAQEIEVDETPIGTFLEVDGDAAGIARVATALGFSPREYLADSYVALFFAGGGKGDMVFP